MVKKRDLKAEYAATHGTAKGKADRAARNKARATAVKKHGKAALKGKEVHHKDHNPRNNKPSNTAIISKTANRKDQPKRGKQRG